MNQRKCGAFWGFLVLLAITLGGLGVGIWAFAINHDIRILLAAAVAFVLVAVAWLVTASLAGANAAGAAKIEELIGPVNERLQHMSVLLNQISEQQLISERAKAIAFRDNERDALRRAIREEMTKKDWDAALMLANEIESVFGYAAEAEQLRQEIRAQRINEVRRTIGDAMSVIDKHCRAEQWTQAMREAERVMKLYPYDEPALALSREVENRRLAHKKQLLDSWNDAVSRHDVDGSIEILKKLDLYLTPQEAASMQETARQVFKDKLVLLGQQFAAAIKDHRYVDAIRYGENIVTEFPNSRMAQEVKEKMDLLKQRAGEEVTAGKA